MNYASLYLTARHRNRNRMEQKHESQGDSWIPRWQLNPKVTVESQAIRLFRLLPYLYGLFPFIQIKVSECARLFELKRNRTITTISNLMDGLCWIKLNKVKKGKEMSAENERTLSSPLI